MRHNRSLLDRIIQKTVEYALVTWLAIAITGAIGLALAAGCLDLAMTARAKSKTNPA